MTNKHFYLVTMVMRTEFLVTPVSFDKKVVNEEGLFEIRPTVDFASAVYDP